MKEKILVIENDNEIRKVIVNFLKENGDYEIFQAAAGKEGIRLFSLHNPQIIITDLNMPEMRGEEVIRIIKRDFQAKTTIIAMGNDFNSESVAKAAGCNVFLKKPFHLLQLQEAVEKLLRENYGQVFTCR